MIRSMYDVVRRTMLAVGMAAVLASAPGTAFAQNDIEAGARQALRAVFDALMTGEAEKVRPLLADEFQIVRSDGAVYGKEDYLARSIPKIATAPTFEQVFATRNGDIVVVSLRLLINEVIDGKHAEAEFPHLIVFRVTPDGWQVVAAANFAKLEG